MSLSPFSPVARTAVRSTTTPFSANKLPAAKAGSDFRSLLSAETRKPASPIVVRQAVATTAPQRQSVVTSAAATRPQSAAAPISVATPQPTAPVGYGMFSAEAVKANFDRRYQEMLEFYNQIAETDYDKAMADWQINDARRQGLGLASHPAPERPKRLVWDEPTMGLKIGSQG